ncbi:MAG: nucleotidyltransferase domain-containing protein [Thermodesulfovibrionales bacterium]|nr:nucleotidyltransferase domain-containing protein [Thermodesulfovibrionales bacterium]
MISIDAIPLNYNEQTGLKGIIEELTGKYPFIKKIILYGSKARGDYMEESDIDLLFITANDIPRLFKMEMSDVIYNHELANDIVVSAIFVSESEFSESVSLFFRKVKKEGIIIWSRE